MEALGPARHPHLSPGPSPPPSSPPGQPNGGTDDHLPAASPGNTGVSHTHLWVSVCSRTGDEATVSSARPSRPHPCCAQDPAFCPNPGYSQDHRPQPMKAKCHTPPPPPCQGEADGRPQPQQGQRTCREAEPPSRCPAAHGKPRQYLATSQDAVLTGKPG